MTRVKVINSHEPVAHSHIDYLGLMYSDSQRPKTRYPGKLALHLVHRFKIPKGSRLLDVGCGRGEFLQGFLDAGVNAQGVDGSPTAGQMTDVSLVTRTDIDSEPLPFADATFDVVFSKSVLEHMSDPKSLLMEQFRVLKHGGLVITMVPAWEYQYKIFYNDFTHRSPLTIVSLQAVTESCGFVDSKSIYFRQLPLLWANPWLLPIAELTRVVMPTSFGKRSKWVRFSKELMLLCSAHRPS